MKFYFTFGFGQKHQNGYHIIEAPDAPRAREIMNHRFGPRWAGMYHSAEEAGVEEYGLHEVKHPVEKEDKKHPLRFSFPLSEDLKAEVWQNAKSFWSGKLNIVGTAEQMRKLSTELLKHVEKDKETHMKTD